MEDWINILLKAFFCGCAALGFGILFNVPKRNLLAIWAGGFIVGLTKFAVLIYAPSSIILASFLASLALGVYSIIVAQVLNESQMIIAIPSVIPLVPGVFAYKTMLGLIKLSGKIGADYTQTLSETVHNGSKTLFVIMAFSIGVVITNQVGKRINQRIPS